MVNQNELIKSLSEEERNLVTQILKEYSEQGKSSTYNDLFFNQYKEIPVDIETFLHDPRYLGKGLTDDDGRFTVFPYWENMLKQLFPTNTTTAYNTLILSGAIGLGKSFIAVVSLLYLLYRMLCLKDPYKFYGLQPIDLITFSFINITKDAAKGVAWNKCQQLVQMSPWFMEHGTVNKADSPEWQPNGGIELIYGSLPRHIIGRAVFCLDGDTIIKTTKGNLKLKDISEKDIQVFSINEKGELVISDVCKVIPTVISNEEYQIELEDGSILKCTPNHKFMLIDGTYKEAQYLTEKDELFDVNLSYIDNLSWRSKMKIKKITKVILDTPKQYYDIVEATPYHNFLIKTNDNYIVSHNCSFEDEISFQPNQDIEKQKEKAKALITSVDARMKSRFMKGEILPTLHILASSKRTDQSFLETYIDLKKQTESKNTLIIDEPQWVIRTDKDSKNKFKVAIGNKFLDSEVLPLNVSEKELQLYRDKGYSIIDVPMGYYENFIEDLDIALTDIAGISTSNAMSYISGSRWSVLRNDSLTNPFTKEILVVGDDPEDKTQYYDFFDLEAVPKDMMEKPLYIHLDMSLSGDKTGIAGVWIKGKKPHQEGVPDSKELYYQLAFSVSIKAPKGRQISFEKNRQFIYWLKEQGFRIKTISSDTYQSADMNQSLTSKGFDYEIISVDRVSDRICVPYQVFKNAIYEERLVTYNTKLLTEEVIGLVRDSNGKIDHSPAGVNCFTGDTKIRLVDGRSLSFLDIIEEFNEGKINYVYSINEHTGLIEPKKIENAWCSGHTNKLIEITLDNNETIRCTPNHLFMLRNGVYCEAQNLKVNDSLMPLYTKINQKGLLGYRLYYEPLEDKWHFEHRNFCNQIYDGKDLVHHKDCNKLNNNPDNLVWVTKQMHQKIHTEMQTGAQSKKSKEKRIQSLLDTYEKDRNREDYYCRWYKGLNASEAQEAHNKLKEKNNLKKLRIENINKLFNIDYEKLSTKEKQSYSSKYSNYMRGYDVFSNKKNLINQKQHDCQQYFGVDYSEISLSERKSLAIKFARLTDSSYQERVSSAVSENHKKGKYIKAKQALQKHNNKLKELKIIFPDVDENIFYELFGFYYKDLNSSQKGVWVNRYRQKLYDLKNHKIIDIKYITCDEDVYDITVEDNHNFALNCGIFVHNSKDQCDAVCGSLYSASKHAEEYAYDYGESFETIMNINQMETSPKQQMIVDFENELKNISTGFLDKQKSNQSQNQTNNTTPVLLYDDILIW